MELSVLASQVNHVKIGLSLTVVAAVSRNGLTNLLVLEAEEKDLFHERQLGLLAPFRALADVSRVKCNLVTILAALVACFGGAVLEVVGGVVAVDAVAALALCRGCSASAAPASSEA